MCHCGLLMFNTPNLDKLQDFEGACLWLTLLVESLVNASALHLWPKFTVVPLGFCSPAVPAVCRFPALTLREFTCLLTCSIHHMRDFCVVFCALFYWVSPCFLICWIFGFENSRVITCIPSVSLLQNWQWPCSAVTLQFLFPSNKKVNLSLWCLLRNVDIPHYVEM